MIHSFYRARRPDGSYDISEEERNSKVEKPFHDLLSFLISDLYVPSREHSNLIIDYVANLFTRTNKRRVASKDIHAEVGQARRDLLADDRAVQQYAAALSLKFGRRVYLDQVRQGWRRAADDPTDHQDYFLQQSKYFEQSIKTALSDRPYSLLKAPKGFDFLLSDNPLITRRVVGNQTFVGFGFHGADVHVLMPVSPDHCLQIGLPMDSKTVSPLELEQINDDFIRVMDKEVYSSSAVPTLQDRVNSFGNSLVYGRDIFKIPTVDAEELLRRLVDDMFDETFTADTARIAPTTF